MWQYVAQVVGSFAVGFYLSWRLTLVLMAAFPCIAACKNRQNNFLPLLLFFCFFRLSFLLVQFNFYSLRAALSLNTERRNIFFPFSSLIAPSAGAFMISAITAAQNQGLEQYAAAGGLATESLGAIRTVTSLNAQPNVINTYRTFLLSAMRVGIVKVTLLFLSF